MGGFSCGPGPAKNVMDEESLVIAAESLRTDLLPRLVGRVFHVTTREAYVRVRSDGVIKSNQSGELGFTFGQSRFSYFRKRGCVSVFDLRTATPEQIDDSLHKYYFLNPPFSKNRPVFLLLADACSEQLLPWSQSIPEEGARAMVIPYVEAGYPGEIPLSLVQCALLLEVPVEKACADCVARLVALISKDATPDDDWTCANCGEKSPSITLLRSLLPDDDEKG